MGAIIFEEKVSQLWIFGAIQVYVGIWYINKGNRDCESGESVTGERTEVAEQPSVHDVNSAIQSKDKMQ